MYQFYALEQHPNNFVNKNMSVKDYKKVDNDYYTPFTKKYATQAQAQEFLTRNLAFWTARGITLSLFKVRS